MTPKTSKSYRLPEATIEQMEWLRQRYGSYTQVIVVAVQQLYREERRQVGRPPREEEER